MPGLIGYTVNQNSRNRKSLQEMLNVMGNFTTDIFYGHNLHVACLHLGIFNKEKQPIWNEDGKLGIMSWGKVYGYEEETKKLMSLGHKFVNPNNDAEFILHAYEEYGDNAFSELNGSYSFIIFNDEENELKIVNDRFGTRPIYYATQDGNLIFASAIKALLMYPYPKILNEKAIAKFFRYGRLGILGDETWFVGIRVMPAASILEFCREKMQLKRYWDLDYSADEDLREESVVGELVEKFRSAVNMRIDDKVNFGISLSGGLDSRAVLGAIDESKRNKIYPYTFGVKESDELKIAEKVTSTLGLKKNHILIKLDVDDLAKYAEKVIFTTDGLGTIDISFLFHVNEKIRAAGVKIFSQGFALDQTLGGSFLKKKIMQAKTMNDLLLALDKRYTLFSPSEANNLLAPKIRRYLKDVHEEFVTMVKKARGNTLQDKADYFTLNTRVRGYTLMGSVIAREFMEETLPTLDNELINVIREIPPNHRYRHRIYKKFLSALDPKLANIIYVDTMIPANAPDIFWKLGTAYTVFRRFVKRILWRFSKGRINIFDEYSAIDMSMAWRISPAWQKLLANTLLNDESLCFRHGYLNKDFVKSVVKEHYHGIKDNNEKIVYLVTFEIFLRTFFSEKQARPSDKAKKIIETSSKDYSR